MSVADMTGKRWVEKTHMAERRFGILGCRNALRRITTGGEFQTIPGRREKTLYGMRNGGFEVVDPERCIVSITKDHEDSNGKTIPQHSRDEAPANMDQEIRGRWMRDRDGQGIRLRIMTIFGDYCD
jgi:hypothetical protein